MAELTEATVPLSMDANSTSEQNQRFSDSSDRLRASENGTDAALFAPLQRESGGNSHEGQINVWPPGDADYTGAQTSSESSARASALLDQDFTSQDEFTTSCPNSRERERSLSDSWPFWDAVSPFLSAAATSWGEALDTSHNAFFRNSLGSCDARQLVRQYDSAKTHALQSHEQYKDSKWGENVFSEFDIDTTDLVNIDLPPFAETLRHLPFSETVAQCVRSYSNFVFARKLSRRLRLLYMDDDDCASEAEMPQVTHVVRPTRPGVRSGESIFASPGQSDTPTVASSSSVQIFTGAQNDKTSESPVIPDVASDTPAQPTGWNRYAEMLIVDRPVIPFGELAVPRAVQEAMDFAFSMSRRASRAFEALMPPACPRRYQRQASTRPPRAAVPANSFLKKSSELFPSLSTEEFAPDCSAEKATDARGAMMALTAPCPRRLKPLGGGRTKEPELSSAPRLSQPVLQKPTMTVTSNTGNNFDRGPSVQTGLTQENAPEHTFATFPSFSTAATVRKTLNFIRSADDSLLTQAGRLAACPRRAVNSSVVAATCPKRKALPDSPASRGASAPRSSSPAASSLSGSKGSTTSVSVPPFGYLQTPAATQT